MKSSVSGDERRMDVVLNGRLMDGFPPPGLTLSASVAIRQLGRFCKVRSEAVRLYYWFWWASVGSEQGTDVGDKFKHYLTI